jgi:hypothetical protein
MRWHTPCSKHPGILRKQFQQWSIPKYIREELSLEDGDQVHLTLSHGELVDDRIYRITSGGEIRLSAALAATLRERAYIQPKTSIAFTLRLLEGLSLQENDFDARVTQSKNTPRKERLARLAVAARKPQRMKVQVSVFVRNPDVVAEVLHRAEGKCESCASAAPFLKKIDDSPYLEVHHRVRLSDGGDDTVDNAVALCPNCHRKMHYGRTDDA